MREIKFRAWDEKNKKIISLDVGGLLSIVESIRKDDIPLMQYTGLKDKNGKEIYEGDIVRASAENAPFIWAVEWIYENAGLLLYRHRPNGEPVELAFYYVNHGEQGMEIVGNIYEHPDLLK